MIRAPPVPDRQQGGVRDHGVHAGKAACEPFRLGEVGASQLDALGDERRDLVGVPDDAHDARPAARQRTDDVAAEEACRTRERDGGAHVYLQPSARPLLLKAQLGDGGGPANEASPHCPAEESTARVTCTGIPLRATV